MAASFLTLLVLVVPAMIVVPISRAGQTTPLAPVTEADGRLGLDDVLPGSPPNSPASWSQLAVAAGARGDRWELRWDRIEPRPGVWNFALDDPAVAGPVAAGMDVLGILIGTPGWATAPGQKPGNGLPRGLGQPISDPRNLWASYVQATVKHYQGQIHQWEIWNEPDLSFFWSGSPADYFHLATVTYRAIKSVDPHATLVLAGMVVPDLRFLTSVLDLARSDTHPPFDVAAWHAYGSSKSLYQNLLAVRAALDTRGFTQTPIWVTESGFPAADPTGEARQAAYVLQSTAYALLAGTARVYVYRASDDATKKQWGLMTTAAQPRMGYVAFQVAARYLAGATDLVYAPTARAERIVAFGPQRDVILSWSTSTAATAFDIPWSEGLQTIDWQGIQTVPPVVGSTAKIALPGAFYNAGGVDPASSVVGGPPVLVQANTGSMTTNAVQAVVTGDFGGGRKILLLNPGTVPIAVGVQSLNFPNRVLPVLLSSHDVARVDPQLISGLNPTGPYLIRSSLPVAAVVTGSQANAAPIAPSKRWWVPRATDVMDITNPTDNPLRVRLAAYSHAGVVQFHGVYDLAGRSTITLREPRMAHNSIALTGTAAFVIADSAGVVAATHPLWDLVHPERGRVQLFNPLVMSAVVDLKFVGARVVKTEHVHLAAHQSFVASSHGARAVIVSASAPIVASSGPESPQAATTSAVALSAPGRLTVFNPSSVTAHVLLRVVHGGKSATMNETLLPLHVVSPVRGSSGGTAVVVQSDVPVVVVRER